MYRQHEGGLCLATDDQFVIGCDETGRLTGEYILKELAHTGLGRRHLAIAVLLYDSHGQVLLQQRKHRVFGDVWDLTGATHPLHRSDGTDETPRQAVLRCLKREYDVAGIDVKCIGVFDYYASSGDVCENEHCALYIGQYDGEIRLNPEVGHGYRWVDKREFRRDIAANPRAYSPWAAEAVKVLDGSGFFRT